MQGYDAPPPPEPRLPAPGIRNLNCSIVAATVRLEPRPTGAVDVAGRGPAKSGERGAGRTPADLGPCRVTLPCDRSSSGGRGRVRSRLAERAQPWIEFAIQPTAIPVPIAQAGASGVATRPSWNGAPTRRRHQGVLRRCRRLAGTAESAKSSTASRCRSTCSRAGTRPLVRAVDGRCDRRGEPSVDAAFTSAAQPRLNLSRPVRDRRDPWRHEDQPAASGDPGPARGGRRRRPPPVVGPQRRHAGVRRPTRCGGDRGRGTGPVRRPRRDDDRGGRSAQPEMNEDAADALALAAVDVLGETIADPSIRLGADRLLDGRRVGAVAAGPAAGDRGQRHLLRLARGPVADPGPRPGPRPLRRDRPVRARGEVWPSSRGHSGRPAARSSCTGTRGLATGSPSRRATAYDAAAADLAFERTVAFLRRHLVDEG